MESQTQTKPPVSKLKKLKRHTINLILIGLIFALLGYITARAEINSRVQAGRAVAATEQHRTELSSLRTANDTLKSENDAYKADKSVVCTWGLQLQANKALRPAVTVPAAAHCTR